MARAPLDQLSPKRIALIKPSALGDIVHALPVLHALRVRFSDAQLTWVLGRPYAALLDGHPDLDATLVFDRRGGLFSAAMLGRELFRRRFDLVVDLQGLLRSGLMCAATRAARRVGLSTSREGASWFYTDVIPVRDATAMHAVDRYWLVAAALGAGAVPKRFDVPLEPTAMTWADDALRSLPRPWLVAAPGSRWPTKRWPAAHFAELIRRARQRLGGTAVVVGSVDEAVLCRSLADMLAAPKLDLAGRTTLPQLAAILHRADVVLANDSGPLHLAAALGRPVVAPYTCTSVTQHGPYRSSLAPGGKGDGGEGAAVASRVWCAGSYLKRCSRLECMTELTPDRLWPTLEEILSRWPSRSRSA